MSKVRISDVRRAVGVYFGLNKSQLLSESRVYAISHPRQMSISICREITKASLADIASHFGGRDHTTAMHAVQNTAARTKRCPDEAQDYALVKQLALRMAEQRWRRELDLVLDSIEKGEIIPAEEPLEMYQQLADQMMQGAAE